jgi:hypothetical protein
LTSTAGASFTGTVGAQVSLTVKVADQFGNPAPQAAHQFAITGGGSLGASSATTDASGSATAAWTLGTVRGTNTLRVATGAIATLFTVVAQADVPATMTVTQGTDQSGKAGTALPVAPRVTVADRFGNPTSSTPVTFAITAGGGALGASGTILADTNGVATGPVWTLGKRNIPQQLTISAGGLSRAITAALLTSFVVDVRFLGTMADDQKAVFTGAAQRISAMITSGAGPVQASGFNVNTACGVTGAPLLNETIPGIVIYASIAPIDGAGKILAQSGPCGFRSASSSYQPGVAVIIFDSADLTTLANGGALEDVATHEMMHAIGFGTLWSTLGLVTSPTPTDPRYAGANAITACRSFGGVSTCATNVPAENTGGSGTFGSHWRETTFSIELMTGYLNPGGNNPLSSMSIASMLDFGYQVSLPAADNYSLPSAAFRAGAAIRAFDDGWESLIGMPGKLDSLEPAGGALFRVKRVPWRH